MTQGASGPRVMLHVDDVGMCHGANIAFLALSRLGRCDCGSVMVPCPWFAEIAEAASQDEALDVGVHLTLTAEKRHYRWRPLTRATKASGLVDGDGYFWRSVAELRRSALAEAVEEELRAQIEAALRAGIDVTHLDDHMGAVYVSEYAPIYVALGAEFDLPILFPRDMKAYGPIHNLSGGLDAACHADLASRLEADGVVLADRVLETPWTREEEPEARYRRLFDGVGEGFTFMALHPNAPGEIEAIEPETSKIRVEEYDILTGTFGERLIEAMPARRIGMRTLRDERRASKGSTPASTRKGQTGAEPSKDRGTTQCSRPS
jgi:chitin disaccharide deacetylase